jgi:nucleotide-binding universal stress UspA family protein
MKKILIPCDFSEVSDNALHYGAALAGYLSADLTLMNVTQYPVINPEVGFAAYTYQDAEKDSLQALNKLAVKLKEEGFSGKIGCYAKMGDITDEVLKYIREHGIDLVVMGISGHGNNLMKNIIGSSAVSVSRGTECPLVIVPPKVTFKVPNFILYACEFEEEVRVHPGFDRVKEICTLFNAELHVVHVVKDDSGYKPDEDHDGSHYILDKSTPSPYLTYIVAEKKASVGLLDFLKVHQTDMIIIEPKKHSWFYNIFHRSVTNEIAFNSPVPVMAVH